MPRNVPRTSGRRTLARRAELLAPVLVPAAYEFCREGRLLACAHGAHQLLRELTAHDLDLSSLLRTRSVSPVALPDDLIEHEMHKPSRTCLLGELTLLRIQRPRLTSRGVDCP